jgi:hypothetical protein
LRYSIRKYHNDYGQVYLHMDGKTEEEKKNWHLYSISIRTFNRQQHSNSAFGTGNRPENCFLHADDLVSVFSPLAKIRFDRWDMTDIGDRTKEPPMPEAKPSQYDKVVSIESFRRLKPI